MKKTWIIGGLLAVTVLSTPMAVSAATGFQGYTGYNLYSNCYNNTTPTHKKETSDQNIVNKVTEFRNTNKATFWATDASAKRISKTYNQEVKSTKTIALTTKKNKGATVRMGMENYNLVSYTAEVSGEVDFK